jgi:hypothetical protein
MIFEDGTGKGYRAKVDENNRLHTDSVDKTILEFSALRGDAFNFNTGSITLTTAGESAVGYFEYLDDYPFVIEELLFIIGVTTGGSGDGIAKIYRNPTGGTIVSGAVPIEVAANRDFSSSKQPVANMYKGAEGNTLTGGTTFAESSRSSFGTVISFDAGPIVIRKGNTLGVSWQPPAGNTSQLVKIAATGFVDRSGQSS